MCFVVWSVYLEQAILFGKGCFPTGCDQMRWVQPFPPRDQGTQKTKKVRCSTTQSLAPLQWQLQEQYSSKALLTIDYLRLSLTANVLDCTGLMITVVCFYLPSSTALNQLNRDNNHLCINMAPLDTTVRQASRLAELAVALISHDISSSTVRHHSTSYLMSERWIH